MSDVSKLRHADDGEDDGEEEKQGSYIDKCGERDDEGEEEFTDPLGGTDKS